MATKLKKEDFDKHNVNGFKIGDKVLIPRLNLASEIIAIDKDSMSIYNVMIDAVGIENFAVAELGRGTLSSLIAMTSNYMMYYRKKALKNKYNAWARSDDLQHVCTDVEEIGSTKSEENDDYLYGEDDIEEDDDIEEEENDNSDTFMIEDYLKDDSSHYSEFYLKPKYNSRVSGSSDWNNETYTGTDSLIEVNYDEVEYIAIVLDSNNSSNNGELLGAILKSAERMSNADGLNQIIIDNIALATNYATVKDLIEDIVHDAYVDDIIRSYNWNSRGMCAVLIKVKYE